MKKSKHSRGRPKGAKCRYPEVAEQLRVRFQASEWKEGVLLPSIRDLAADLGVNRSVVSHALDLLKEEGRIRQMPNRSFAILDTFENKLSVANLVLVIAGVPHHKVLAAGSGYGLQKGLEKGVSKYSSSLLITGAYPYRDTIPKAFLAMPLRGAFVFGPCKRQVLKMYEALHLPIVLLDQPGEGLKISSVSVDNETAAFEAVNHLLNLGHRRIAFQRRILTFHKDVDPDSKDRQKGFKRAMKAAGWPSSNALVLSFFEDNHPDSPTIQTLFKKRPPFTAVVCSDEGGASNIIQAAQDRGMAIPRDLSVAVFAPKTSRRPLGGPKIDFEGLGLKAASLLEKPGPEIQHLKVQAVWEPRATIGKPI